MLIFWKTYVVLAKLNLFLPLLVLILNHLSLSCSCSHITHLSHSHSRSSLTLSFLVSFSRTLCGDAATLFSLALPIISNTNCAHPCQVSTYSSNIKTLSILLLALPLGLNQVNFLLTNGMSTTSITSINSLNSLDSTLS